jgi:hypothetical protein
MPILTPNLGLKKPLDNEAGDIAVINENMDKLDAMAKDLKQSVDSITIEKIGAAKQSDFAAHLADYVMHPANGGTTGGTATEYTCNSSPNPTALVDKIGVVITAHLDSGTNPTLKWGSTSAYPIKGKLKEDGIYTLRFNATTSVFIVQGEGGAEGNVTRDKVLTGTTYTDPTTGDLTSGTMVNRGKVDHTITNQNGQFSIPQGYHDGSGVVKATYQAGKQYATGFFGEILPGGSKQVTVGFVPKIFTFQGRFQRVDATLGYSILYKLSNGSEEQATSRNVSSGILLITSSLGNVMTIANGQTSSYSIYDARWEAWA